MESEWVTFEIPGSPPSEEYEIRVNGLLWPKASNSAEKAMSLFKCDVCGKALGDFLYGEGGVIESGARLSWLSRRRGMPSDITCKECKLKLNPKPL